MNVGWLLFHIDDVKIFLQTLRHRTPEQILKGGAVTAERLEAKVKRDAPWTDRTGLARATLEGINQFGNNNDYELYYIGVCGNQPYSPKLENSFGHRYSVLEPTMRREASGLLDEIRNIISQQEGVR